MDKNELASYIKDVPDFPKPGIIFKDISPLLSSTEARKQMTEFLIAPYIHTSVDVIVGIESRGFLFGTLIADALNVPFLMLRKSGKLPGEVISQEYHLEYGTDCLEIQSGILKADDKVLIHDDVLATGGTAAAAEQLILKAQANIIGHTYLIELDFLSGRKLLASENVHSVIHY